MKKIKLPKKVIIQDKKEIVVTFRELGKQPKVKPDKQGALRVHNKKLCYALENI